MRDAQAALIKSILGEILEAMLDISRHMKSINERLDAIGKYISLAETDQG